MPRLRKIKDPEEFRRQHANAGSMRQLAEYYNCTLPVIYNECKAQGLPTIKIQRVREIRATKSLKVFQTYRGAVSASWLATRFNLTEQSIRLHLKRAVKVVWSDPTVNWARPPKLKYIRLYHELVDGPQLFDDPMELARKTGLTIKEVAKYMRLSFEHRKAKQAQVSQPVGSGVQTTDPGVAVRPVEPLRRGAAARPTHAGNGASATA